MDPFTHALTGLAVSHAVCSQSNYKGQDNFSFKTFALSVVTGAVIPDADIVASIFGGSTTYFMVHRGITHSLAGLLVLPILCTVVIRFFNKKQPYFRLWIGAFIGMLSHILLDLTNVYSTLALWPITDKMYSFNLMPIMDLFVFIAYITAILLSLKPFKEHRRKIFVVSVSLVVCYVGMRALIQNDIIKHVKTQYTSGKLLSSPPVKPIQKISILSNSINILSWTYLIDNKDSFIKGEVKYHLNKSTDIISMDKVEKKPLDITMQKASETPLGKFVLKFSPYVDYKVESYKDGTIVKMIDLRYGNIKLPLNSARSHFFGGYTVLDNMNRVTYWGTSYPVK